MKLLMFFLFFNSVIFADSESGVTYIRKVIDDTIKIAINKKLSIEEKRNEVIFSLSKEFDSTWNARMSLGKIWNEFTDDDRKKYINSYCFYIAYQWLPKLQFTTANDIKINVSEKIEKINETDFYVDVNILSPDGKSYFVIFRVSKNENNFIIRDLSVDGVSLAITNRSQFSSFIEEKGIKSFLSFLDNKIEESRKNIKINELKIRCNAL